MYKMVVFDIDGTLLKHKETSLTFGSKNLKMFKELKKGGYTVVLASGRDLVSIGDLHFSDNIDYFIGANGSFIYDTKLQKNIWSTTLSIKDFTDFKREILDNNIDQIDNIILSDDKNVFVYSYEQIHKHWFWKDFTNKYKPLNLYDKEVNLDQFHLITINCIDKKIINISKEFFKKTNSSLDVQTFWRNGFFVSEKGLNKAKTILKLVEFLNLTKENVIAFGDGENDVEMIKMAGMGIAMSNGIPKLKEIADDVADDVANNGTYGKLKDMGII